MSNELLWKLAYHLAGPTLLGKTAREPLGPLPVPIRTAVLKTVAELDPEAIAFELCKQDLLFAEGEYEWVAWWRYRDRTLGEVLRRIQVGTRLRYASTEDYYREHNLARPEGETEDEHYAERFFVEEVFWPLFGLEGLSYLRPQVPFRDSDDRQRYIDFVLEGARKYAIEIEGETYHSEEHISQERFDDETQRRRSLSDAGYDYYPFTFSEIQQGRARDALNELTSRDPVLARLIRMVPTETDQPATPLLTYLKYLLHFLPQRYPLYQKVALTMLWKASAQGRAHLRIAEYQPTVAALALAMLDTVALVERVAELYNLPITLPQIDFYLIEPVDRFGVKRLLFHYLGGEPGEANRCVDASRTVVRLLWATELPTDVDYVFGTRAIEDVSPENALTYNELGRFVAPFLVQVGSIPPLNAQPVPVNRPVLDYFARRYFLVPELKPEQVELINRVLCNESGVGILPTGFGKSLVFQLYALLVPRTTLVISPLRSLIRDQVHHLHRLGLTCVQSITSDDRAARNERLGNFFNYRYRLLYIAPERLRITSFSNALRAQMSRTPVGALVVDETHCVSEWGHDFRPAYLQIARLRQNLEEASGRSVPIIALTATASDEVRKDILSVLNLQPDSVEQLASSDRPNFSLSVHPVNEPERKSEELARLVQEVIPRILNIPFNELIPINSQPPYPHAGVIFGIYADAHGRTTLGEGVHYIAQEIQDRIVSDANLVQVHASTAPTKCCPSCESPLSRRATHQEIRDAGRDPQECTEAYLCLRLRCNHLFDEQESVEPTNWDEEILRRQDDFQDNQFPLLVATKGYGMGVDKRNIRFLIHHALSSGLEGYYQEAGRAGRDNQHAHIALMYLQPHPDCRRNEIDAGHQPRCVADAENYQFYKCPYYQNHLCDYGHQARFIRGDYPGIQTDVDCVLRVYNTLDSGSPLVVTGDRENNNTENALYRLQQLGIVKEYALEYLSLSRIRYEVEFNHDWTREQLTEALKTFLIQTNISPEAVEGELNQILHNAVQESILTEAVRILLKRIYDIVPQMRYQMLRNELEYATTPKCRRIIIRSVFDHVVLDDYQCGFCDVCVENLQFGRDRAHVPVGDAHVDEIVQQLPHLLTDFDTTALQEVVRIAVERHAVIGLRARVTSHLESNPTNLAALYLAGLLRRSSEDERSALTYLKNGFEEGMRQGLSPERLLLFYQEGAHLDPEEAFAWLTRGEGPWDSEEGLSFLITESEARFGADSTHYRTLRALRQIRAMRILSETCASLTQRLEILRQGFDRLDEMMEDENHGGSLERTRAC